MSNEPLGALTFEEVYNRDVNSYWVWNNSDIIGGIDEIYTTLLHNGKGLCLESGDTDVLYVFDNYFHALAFYNRCRLHKFKPRGLRDSPQKA